jgi:hypothetical protein
VPVPPFLSREQCTLSDTNTNNITAKMSFENTTPQASNYYSSDLADLGSARFTQEVAAIDPQRDLALKAGHPVSIARGRAPPEKRGTVFAWNIFGQTTDDIDVKEQAKGDLHGGHLHRLNRAAAQMEQPPLFSSGPATGHTSGWAKQGKRGKGKQKEEKQEQIEGVHYLQAASRPDHDAAPLAKGKAAELDNDLFWNEPIV